MVSQPDGFIKRTDAARPCQGLKEEGLGPACQDLCVGVGVLCQGGTPPGKSLSLSAKDIPLPSSNHRVRFKVSIGGDALHDSSTVPPFLS